MIKIRNAKSGDTENRDDVWANLRDIRAEVQNLKKTLSEIKEIKEKSNLTTQSVLPDLRNNLYEIKSDELFNSNSKQIIELFKSIKKILKESPAIYDEFGDGITYMDNLWERIELFWPRLPVKSYYNLNKKDNFDLNKICLHIDVTESMMNDLVFHATRLTIPHRVNHQLDLLSVGQSLNFHEAFEEELPDHDERVKVLKHMYSKPKLVNGVVDVENGKIYRASPNKIRRYVSYILILGMLVLGGFVVYLFAYIGQWLGLSNWLTNPDEFRSLIAGYLFIIVGGIVHIMVNSVKEYRASKGQTFLAIGNWLLWIHVNEVQIIVGIISLWIGFFGLVLFIPDNQPLWQIAFFVGYSIDSFVDIFLERFTNTISTRTESLKQQLG